MSIADRAAVREDLLADLAGVTGSIVAAVRAEIPAYATLAAAQLQEVSAIAAWGTTRVLEAWVDDSRLDEEDLRRFRGIGAARALDGRPLPVVLRAYRVAGSTVTDLVAARALDRLEVADALALARLWMASIDALSEALYAGHAAASERIGGDRELALGDLLHDLLTGRHATAAAIADRTRELGVRLPPRPLLLVAAPGPRAEVAPDPWHEAVARLLDLAGEEPGAPHLARVREGLGVALLPSLDRTTLAGVLSPRGWTTVALARHRADDLPRAHRLARHALEHAPPRAARSRGVLDDADAAALAIAAGHRDASPATLRRLVLGPLDGRSALLEALDAYLATGSAAEAAGLTHCHPQTVRYRVRRIRELTGRDLRLPWDRFVLELARLSSPGAGPAPTVAP